MNLNFEQKSVGKTTYLALDIDNSLVIDSFAMKMMAYNHILNIVPVQIVQMNEHEQVQFNVTGLTKLNNRMTGVRPKKDVLSVFNSIINAFEEVDAYMLDRDHLLLDWKYVYLDAQDNCMLLYLPFGHDCGMDQIEFLRDVVSRIKPDYQERDPYLYDILNAFGRGAVRSLSDFRELIKKSAGAIPNRSVEENKGEYKKEQSKDAVQTNSGQMVRSSFRDVQTEEKDAIPETVNKKAEKKVLDRTAIPVINIPGREPGKNIVSSEPDLKQKENKKKKEDKKGIFHKKTENKKPVIMAGKQKRGKIVIPGTESEQSLALDDRKAFAADKTDTRENEMYESYEDTVIMQEEIAVQEEEGTVLLESSDDAEQTKARLIRKQDGLTYWIQSDRITVGSGQATDIHIENKAVSRNHAVIVCINGQYYIEDNQSKNGSYIEGKRLQPGMREAVHNGMAVRFANEEFEFCNI